MSIVSEFRTFIQRGNVIDLAVGIIIGAGFTKIVSSLVADVLTPPLGLLIGGISFSALRIAIGGTPDHPVTINIGNFLQAVFDFFIVASCVFLLVKSVNVMKRPANVSASTTELNTTEKLLAEIRDLLKVRP